MIDLINPDWPAPAWVKAVTTARSGGVSGGPFSSLNLADHVGDDPVSVRRNRVLLREKLDLPADPLWLRQVHGCSVAGCESTDTLPEADAAVSNQPGRICAVLTADCLPVLICNQAGTQVAAVHAGWRGLAAGVIEAALARFNDAGSELFAWLGPAIGPGAYEVGEEVRSRFLTPDAGLAGAFHPSGRSGHWMADLYHLARSRLEKAGVGFVGGGDYCTVTDSARFFSYRRDGVTGRMATLIWIDPDHRTNANGSEKRP